MTSRSRYIGIDPGKSGGITVIDKNFIKTHKCPNTTVDMATLFEIMLKEKGDYKPGKVIVGIEKVWSFPSDGRSTAFTFGVNYGQWQGIIGSHEIKPIFITPKEWQSYFNTPKKLKKVQRKNWIKDKAKELYPGLKVTLATSDAILIAKYLQQTCS